MSKTSMVPSENSTTRLALIARYSRSVHVPCGGNSLAMSQAGSNGSVGFSAAIEVMQAAPVLELPPLPRRGDVEDLAVFRHRPAGQVDALVLELGDDFVVVEGILLVLEADDRLELFLDGVPAHVFAFGAGGAAGEETPEREHAAGRLDPFFRDRARHRRHMDAELVGHLDHRERLEKLPALVEEIALGVHHCPDDPHARALALLDALEKPAGVSDVVGQELARLLVAGAVFQPLAIQAADEEIRGRVVGHLDFVAVVLFVVVDDGVGDDWRGVVAPDLLAGVRLQPPEAFYRRLQIVDRAPDPPANLRVAVHL